MGAVIRAAREEWAERQKLGQAGNLTSWRPVDGSADRSLPIYRGLSRLEEELLAFERAEAVGGVRINTWFPDASRLDAKANTMAAATTAKLDAH